MTKYIKMIEDSRKLRWVQRIQQFPRLFPQSVAEHTFGVVFIGRLLAEMYNSEVREEDRISVETVMTRCLFHDFQEALTGDIAYPIAKRLGASLAEVEEELISERYSTSDMDYGDKLKDDTVEGEIVDFADEFELYLTVKEEVEAGNKRMIELVDICEDLLRNSRFVKTVRSYPLPKIRAFLMRQGVV